MAKCRTVILAGTGVTPLLAPHIYGKLSRALRAPVFTLRHYGLGSLHDAGDLFLGELGLGEPPVVVGHSQGAVVALLAAQRKPSMIRGVVSLGGPVNGCPWAVPFSPVPAVREMCSGSSTMHGLKIKVPCEAVVGTHDFLVPPASGSIAGKTKEFPVGHMGLISNREVISYVKHVIASWAITDTTEESSSKLKAA